MSLRVARAERFAPFTDGKAILLSVRPEAIEVHSLANSSADGNAVTGRVVASAYQGSIIEYEIVARNKSIRAHTVNPKGKPIFERGQDVLITFSPEDVVIVSFA